MGSVIYMFIEPQLHAKNIRKGMNQFWENAAKGS